MALKMFVSFDVKEKLRWIQIFCFQGGDSRGAIWGGGGGSQDPPQIFQGAKDSTTKGPLPAIIITLKVGKIHNKILEFCQMPFS